MNDTALGINRARLISLTPDADNLIAQLARVSNPQNERNRDTAPRLIRYLIDHQHWSPFETVHATVEVVTTRDIGRQILRHRSFSFQEFSGRYAEYNEMLFERMMRYQDPTNRQSSLIPNSDKLVDPSTKESQDWAWWCEQVEAVGHVAYDVYKEALERGIAKEVARSILPEGLVPTRMYIAGSIRSFIHYCQERLKPGVQYEHQMVAAQVLKAVFSEMPLTLEAINNVYDLPDLSQII